MHVRQDQTGAVARGIPGYAALESLRAAGGCRWAAAQHCAGFTTDCAAPARPRRLRRCGAAALGLPTALVQAALPLCSAARVDVARIAHLAPVVEATHHRAGRRLVRMGGC